MKRQSSSSNWTAKSPEHLHAKTIGCMSGIFHFLYKFRNPRKLLTSGKKEESERARDSVKIQEKAKENVLRSPALPAEIRTSPSTVVTRLMGVECESETAEEKRRKLVGALEKCDEELKTVQRIIEVMKRSVSVGSDEEIIGHNVSAAADFALSPDNTNLHNSDSKIGRPSIQRQQKQQQKKKPGEEEEIIDACLADRFTRDWVNAEGENVVRRKAMIDNVNQVCTDIAWGERREIGRIGLALQDYICRDLIEEIVREMGNHSIHLLPFEACKRRLCF
ncbi:hypothetical protein SLA2020_149690 [Shorea laevis]